MSKKRPAHLQLEFGRPMKRVKLAHQADVVSLVECTLPVQPECELGPFWISIGGRHSIAAEQRAHAAVEASCSLGSWALSLSLGCTGPVADVEDEDTQDTASSGSDEGSMKAPACTFARQPRAAATGEEDSITSSQPHPMASAAFSFGSRPYLTPDLTAVECWDIVNTLLAAV